MPDTFGESFSHPILHDPSSNEPTILPIHVAQYRQNIEQERRKSLAEQGIELDAITKGKESGSKALDLQDDECGSAEDDTSEDKSLLQLVQSSPQMQRKSRNTKEKSPGRRGDLHISTSQNGDANGYANGDMNNQFELRRKTTSIDSPTARAHLIGRSDFTLDDEPPPITPQTPGLVTTSFSNLPVQDKRNFLLLCLLYFLQGIPLGLSMGSVPFLLKSHFSYGQIGIFSLAAYPYSLKLLWSPIVDAVWSRRFGRRKSWITPIQTISGVSLIWLGARINKMMVAAGEHEGAGVWSFTGWWFMLVLLCATQDIAVDGWAISLLSVANLSYASTAQTVGLTAGSFLSHTVFLAFNAPDFANRWFRTTPKDYGLMSLGGYMEFWGWVYLIVTFGLVILKKEDKTKERDSIMEVYRSMLGVLKLKNIHTLIIIMLIAKLGFVTNDAVTNLKLLDKGFGQANLALVVLIDFPFEISLGYYAGKWSAEYTPLKVWCWAFTARLLAAIFAQVTIMVYPSNPVPLWYMLVVILEHIYSTFMNTVMFVSGSAFFARIADPAIGGTYMTLLATYVSSFRLCGSFADHALCSVSNLGGTFPKFFLLKLVDMLTIATCQPPSDPSSFKPLDPSISPVRSPFSCALEADKHRCSDGGGTCVIERDGFYYTNIIFVIIGALTFWGYIQRKALRLQALPLRAWRLNGEPGRPREGS
jgi:MFS transporter, PAT family, solute carrier family 33 (acetyl-CoA transportor), member 1